MRKAVRVARRIWWAARPRRSEHGFDAVRTQFYRDFWHQAAGAVGAELEELDAGYWQARRGDAWTFILQGQVAIDDHLRVRMARNKLLTARLLGPLGFTTPPSVEFDLDSIDKAVAFMSSIQSRVVIKPDGIPASRFVTPEGPGAGRGVTCGVSTSAELLEAARWASLFGASMIAEKMVEGASCRLLYLDGVLIDAVRRDPPRVFGDGISTIEELIDAENAERLAARPPSAFSPLQVDLDARLTLAREGLQLRSVPRALKPVTVKTVSNENAHYDNHVVLDTVHPELARLGKEMVRKLGLRLAGVDVMTSDLSRPSAEGISFFTEINATPGLHHHCLVAETQRRAPVGALVLEAALRGTRH
jgi:cyanophycin synthetase